MTYGGIYPYARPSKEEYAFAGRNPIKQVAMYYSNLLIQARMRHR